MDKKINNTYNNIINYIKSNRTKLEIEELKFLLNYAYKLKENCLENTTNIDINSLINDLKNYIKI